MTGDRPVLGTLMMLAFCLTAPLVDTAAKLASDAIPVGQITAARYIAQALILVPVMAVMRLDFRMHRDEIGHTFLRAGLSVLATATFVGAISVMPLADALAIAFVEPFLLLLIGHFILSETVGLAASISHLLLTYALRFASSTVLAPLQYLELISATFFGYVVFSDFPDPATWIGIGIMAASGIYIIHRERVTARSVAVSVAPPGPAP